MASKIEDPDICQSPDSGLVHHHWVPVRAGTYQGEPSYEMRCQYCNLSYAEHTGQNGGDNVPKERNGS